MPTFNTCTHVCKTPCTHAGSHMHTHPSPSINMHTHALITCRTFLVDLLLSFSHKLQIEVPCRQSWSLTTVRITLAVAESGNALTAMQQHQQDLSLSRVGKQAAKKNAED